MSIITIPFPLLAASQGLQACPHHIRDCLTNRATPEQQSTANSSEQSFSCNVLTRSSGAVTNLQGVDVWIAVLLEGLLWSQIAKVSAHFANDHHGPKAPNSEHHREQPPARHVTSRGLSPSAITPKDLLPPLTLLYLVYQHHDNEANDDDDCDCATSTTTTTTTSTTTTTTTYPTYPNHSHYHPQHIPPYLSLPSLQQVRTCFRV